MKKAFLPLLASIAMAFSLTSCEHQTMKVMEVTIHSNEWVKPAAANYLMASVSWDELDEDVVDYGSVTAYLIDENGRQNMLPYLYPMTYTEDVDGTPLAEPYTVAENTRFDYRYGVISFILEDLDGIQPTGSIPSLTFRVVALGD